MERMNVDARFPPCNSWRYRTTLALPSPKSAPPPQRSKLSERRSSLRFTYWDQQLGRKA